MNSQATTMLHFNQECTHALRHPAQTPTKSIAENQKAHPDESGRTGRKLPSHGYTANSATICSKHPGRETPVAFRNPQAGETSRPVLAQQRRMRDARPDSARAAEAHSKRTASFKEKTKSDSWCFLRPQTAHFFLAVLRIQFS